MATLEEQHSTRGRAHMLFELLQGEVVRDGWKDEQVKQALDLCLSCKACKSECPANVDIATYKAEFLSHYYEDRRRPLRAQAFGQLDRWAALGSCAPSIANFVTHAPLLRDLVRKALDLAPEREVPRLASINFRKYVRQEGVPVSDGKRRTSGEPEVVLWVDTFNNYFHPETSRAAVKVLRQAGFRVSVNPPGLCCGRPLYDFGMIAQAKDYLWRIMREFDIEAGLPVVVLEPGCASVFRDELRNLFPADPRAARLANQTFLLSEFLEKYAPSFRPPQISASVLLHGHCHHKALMKMGDEESVLRKMGVNLKTLDSGCCGMAGSFGFESEKYGVSQAVGERLLLPAVGQAAPWMLIISDGFSCREQIAQATGRRAMHIAEVLELALSKK